MSNKNNRVKRLEKTLKAEVEALQEDIMFLNEENSELRMMLDEQNDYIKLGFREFREALAEQHISQIKLSENLEGEKKLRRHMDNKLREEIAVIGNRIVRASWTWLGKFIFK